MRSIIARCRVRFASPPKWHSNVYLTAPEPVKGRGKSLEELAGICFKRHTKDTEPMRVELVRFDERELVTG